MQGLGPLQMMASEKIRDGAAWPAWRGFWVVGMGRQAWRR